jgi:hypothetical protein
LERLAFSYPVLLLFSIHRTSVIVVPSIKPTYLLFFTPLRLHSLLFLLSSSCSHFLLFIYPCSLYIIIILLLTLFSSLSSIHPSLLFSFYYLSLSLSLSAGGALSFSSYTFSFFFKSSYIFFSPLFLSFTTSFFHIFFSFHSSRLSVHTFYPLKSCAVLFLTLFYHTLFTTSLSLPLSLSLLSLPLSSLSPSHLFSTSFSLCSSLSLVGIMLLT